MSKKRILIFSLAYHPMVGGAEIAVKEITDRISNIEFDMVTLRFDKAHPEKEKMGNVNIYRIYGSKTAFPFRAFWMARKLHKVNKYDAIWAIMANWAGLAALFFKYHLPEVEYILTIQEGDSLEYIKKKVRFIYPLFKKIFTRADKVQVISNFLAKWAKDTGYKGKVEVIPNGVNVRKFKNQHPKIKKDTVILITVSRLVVKNAVGNIIEALKFLSEDVKLKILGTGLLESELKLLAQRTFGEGWGARVEFLGSVPNDEIPKYLHEADIFVRPSLSEGQGISFIEAMAAGLPVIATPVGGIVDFLHDGETGLFCEVNNPESIAQQVRRLIDDQSLSNKVVINAEKMVKEGYDWDIIASEMKGRVFDKV